MTRRRLSRRGHYLLAFGLVQVALGLAYLAPSPTEAGQLSATFLPPAMYATASVVAGILAAAAAFVRPALERAAFTALAVTAALRCLAFLAVLVALQQVALVTGVLAFGLLLRVHLLVAGWPDPPPTAAVTLTQEQLELLAEELRRRRRDR